LPPAGYTDYQEGVSPGFYALEQSMLGDAGTSADGFDSDLAAVMGLLAGLDGGDSTLADLLALEDGPLADLLALDDTLDDVLEVGQAMDAADESGLDAAIQSLLALPAGPPAFSMPPLPGLPSIPAPAVESLTAGIEALVTGQIQVEIQDVEVLMDTDFQFIINWVMSLALSGGLGNPPFLP
jgi:hypothetical protein